MNRILAVCAGLLSSLVPIYAQSGTIRGSVLDPSGAAIKGAAATIQNPVSHYARTVTTDDQGKFEFENVPYNNYHFTASAPNFRRANRIWPYARQFHSM
jgi:protocatechuate 3,4-dioxygenase beta subunit